MPRREQRQRAERDDASAIRPARESGLSHRRRSVGAHVINITNGATQHASTTPWCSQRSDSSRPAPVARDTSASSPSINPCRRSRSRGAIVRHQRKTTRPMLIHPIRQDGRTGKTAAAGSDVIGGGGARPARLRLRYSGAEDGGRRVPDNRYAVRPGPGSAGVPRNAARTIDGRCAAGFRGVRAQLRAGKWSARRCWYLAQCEIVFAARLRFAMAEGSGYISSPSTRTADAHEPDAAAGDALALYLALAA